MGSAYPPKTIEIAISLIPVVGPRWNQTAILSFGHFCAEVPKSLRIGAYPLVLLIAALCGAATKSLQVAIFTDRWSQR